MFPCNANPHNSAKLLSPSAQPHNNSTQQILFFLTAHCHDIFSIHHFHDLPIDGIQRWCCSFSTHSQGTYLTINNYRDGFIGKKFLSKLKPVFVMELHMVQQILCLLWLKEVTIRKARTSTWASWNWLAFCCNMWSEKISEVVMKSGWSVLF